MPLQSQVDEGIASSKEQPAASIQGQLHTIGLQTRRHTDGFPTGLILCSCQFLKRDHLISPEVSDSGVDSCVSDFGV